MDEWNDELDDLDVFDDDLTTTTDIESDEFSSFQQEENTPEVGTDSDVIDNLLKDLNIDDRSKILYDNEGIQEEVHWDSLPLEEKVNILRNNINLDPETDLEDDEIQLINSIRSSKMSPREYLDYYANQAAQSNTTTPEPQYQVDSYSDDELYVYDLISRMDNITDEEVIQELQRAKENPELFNKKIGAIREEYKNAENEQIQQQQYEAQQEAQAKYDQFAQVIADEINNFTDFSGYDLNMDRDDMEELYEFIVGYDAAGNNHFAKTLNDPKLVTQMAWFALHGQDMINDITNYYNKEITNVRKVSYQKGYEDAKNSSSFVYKPKSNKNNYSSDFDDFE